MNSLMTRFLEAHDVSIKPTNVGTKRQADAEPVEAPRGKGLKFTPGKLLAKLGEGNILFFIFF
jgi:hypothetical protein